MVFGPKHGHFLYIFDNFIKEFGLLVIALILGFVSGDFIGVVTDNFYIAVIVLIAPVQRLLSYLFMTIEIDSEKIVVHKGVFVKHVIEVPVSTVTTVDFSQNILAQIFGAYKIKIDNTSNISMGNSETKVEMTFGKKDALLIKNMLESNKKEIDGFNLVNEGYLSESADVDEHSFLIQYSVPAVKIFLMGLLESKWVLFLEGVGLASMIFGYIKGRMLENAIDSILALSYVLIIAFVVFLICFMFIVGSAIAIIKYTGFNVIRRKNGIHISYGLFTKKSYTLIPERISGFSYKQTWLMRHFHVGTVEVFAVGFGQDSDDNTENAIIHPLLEEEKLNDFISSFMNGIDLECEIENPKKSSIRYFFYRPIVVLCTLILAAAIVLSVFLYKWIWVIGTVIFLLMIFGRIMEYRHSGAGIAKDSLELITGGYNTKKTFVKKSMVEAVTDTGSLFKRRKNIVSIKVDFLGPILNTSVVVKNLSIDCGMKIRKTMEY